MIYLSMFRCAFILVTNNFHILGSVNSNKLIVALIIYHHYKIVNSIKVIISPIIDLFIAV